MKKQDLLSAAFEKFESDALIEKSMAMIVGGMFTGTSGCATGDTYSGTDGAADDCDCDTDDPDNDSIPAIAASVFAGEITDKERLEKETLELLKK